MSISFDREKYKDCFVIFQRAMEADKGIRIHCTTKGSALNLRTRLHAARAFFGDDLLLNKVFVRVKERKDGWYVILERLDTYPVEEI
jgi:hypothetical protein